MLERSTLRVSRVRTDTGSSVDHSELFEESSLSGSRPPVARRRWRDQAPPASSWEKRCDLLAALTRGEGGVVVFTQFLRTQAALAEDLGRRGVTVFVINGQTPVPQRQPGRWPC